MNAQSEYILNIHKWIFSKGHHLKSVTLNRNKVYEDLQYSTVWKTSIVLDTPIHKADHW